MEIFSNATPLGPNEKDVFGDLIHNIDIREENISYLECHPDEDFEMLEENISYLKCHPDEDFEGECYKEEKVSFVLAKRVLRFVSKLPPLAHLKKTKFFLWRLGL